MSVVQRHELDPLEAKLFEKGIRDDSRRYRKANSRRRREIRGIREKSVPLTIRLGTKGIGNPERGIAGIVIRSRRDVGQRFTRLNESEPKEENGHYGGIRTPDKSIAYKVPIKNILDYFGFIGGEQDRFLATFGKSDHSYGVLRAAYHLARYFGLNGNYEKKEKRELFGAIAYSVHKRGIMDTDLVISSVGLRNLVHFENYKIMNIGGKPSLVQEGGLEMLAIRVGTLPLASAIGPSLMKKNGYSSMQFNGVTAYSTSPH